LTAALSDAQPLRQLQAVQLWKLPPRVIESDLDDLFGKRDVAAARFRL
jgi:hypothetical protein